MILENKKITNGFIRFGINNLDISKLKILDIFVVTEEYEMRADLISVKYYGNKEYWDVILRFNGIANPFSLVANMKLYIPDINNIKFEDIEVINIHESEIDNNVKKQFKDMSNMDERDKNRLQYILEKTKKKNLKNNEFLPPNILRKGESNIIIDNRDINNPKIILGGFISNNK